MSLPLLITVKQEQNLVTSKAQISCILIINSFGEVVMDELFSRF